MRPRPRHRRAEHDSIPTRRDSELEPSAPHNASATASKHSLSLTVIKLTALYAAVALLAIGASQATAAIQGVADTRAQEASLMAVTVVAALWIYALYRVMQPYRPGTARPSVDSR